MKIDYSQWLTSERLAEEERLWSGEGKTWPIFIDAIERVSRLTRVDSVLEFGCGTGWVPAALSADVDYVGIDANPGCIRRAQRRCPDRWFGVQDIREYSVEGFDLVCAFSFLKHFGLDEWMLILQRLTRCGRYALFSMPMGPETKDDGTEFPHVWITQEYLEQALRLVHHEIVSLAPIATGETMVLTRRC